MHGEWMALARLGGFHLWSASWWPWWGAGSPLEYTYPPGIPVLTAVIARVAHCSLQLAFHRLTGVTYCLTPLLLYLTSWKISGAAGYSFAAGVVCFGVAHPAGSLPDANAFHFSSFWDARRMMLVFQWDDLPHVVSITLLPLAVWFLWRALNGRRWLDFGITGFIMAAMMLASMFGLVLIAFTVVTIPLAMLAEKNAAGKTAAGKSALVSNFASAAATAVSAYIVVCPWVTPSLLLKIRADSIWDGEAASTSVTLITLGIVALACAGVYADRTPPRRRLGFPVAAAFWLYHAADTSPRSRCESPFPASTKPLQDRSGPRGHMDRRVLPAPADRACSGVRAHSADAPTAVFRRKSDRPPRRLAPNSCCGRRIRRKASNTGPRIGSSAICQASA